MVCRIVAVNDLTDGEKIIPAINNKPKTFILSGDLKVSVFALAIILVQQEIHMICKTQSSVVPHREWRMFEFSTVADKE